MMFDVPYIVHVSPILKTRTSDSAALEDERLEYHYLAGFA